MAFDTLQTFQEKHPGMDLGYARLNSAAGIVTFFVEGASDAEFYRQWLSAEDKVRIKAIKKSGVLANYKNYMAAEIAEKCCYFFVDTDYDWYTSELIGNSCFFYQMYDVEKRMGYNDLECFLLHGKGYNKFMARHGYSQKKATEIRKQLVDVGAFIGSYRLADLIVSKKRKLNETCGMLHGGPEDKNQETEKLNVRYLCEKMLLLPENWAFPGNDVLEINLTKSFGNGPNAKYLDEVFKTARDICEKWEPDNKIGLCRGHDLTELLARRLVADKKMMATGELNSRQFVKDGSIAQNKTVTACDILRENVEQWLHACTELSDLQQFPVGKLFK